jgi:hypothetical protein
MPPQGLELGPLHRILERFGVAVGDTLAAPSEDKFRYRSFIGLTVPLAPGPMLRFLLLLKRVQLLGRPTEIAKEEVRSITSATRRW